MKPDRDVYYLGHDVVEDSVYDFVVFRDQDLVILKGSEKLSKVMARIRWNLLVQYGWKPIHDE